MPVTITSGAQSIAIPMGHEASPVSLSRAGQSEALRLFNGGLTTITIQSVGTVIRSVSSAIELEPGVATGASAGSSAVVGVGASSVTAVGSASGLATASGVGAASVSVVGTSAGTSAVSGVAETAENIGSASGTSTVSGVGVSSITATGSAGGTSTAAATGRSSFTASGTAAGSASVPGVGVASVSGVGSASGTGTASGVSVEDVSGFEPESLFSSGEQGAIFDPSDLETMYRTTGDHYTVSETGDRVHGMRNKSQVPIDLGFATEWENISYEVFSTTGGSFSAEKVSAGGRQIALSNGDFNITLNDLIEFTATGVATGMEGISLSDFTNQRTTTFRADALDGTAVGVVRANANSGSKRIKVSSVNTDTITIDSISVRKFVGGHAYQGTASKAPTYRFETGLHALLSDGVDDTLTAPLPDLGTNATVWYATEAGTFILSSQTISGTFELLRGTNTYAVGAIDRTLTTQEIADLTAYLDAKRGAA